MGLIRMNKRDATGEDVANLLLSFATDDWLEKFDLTHENKHEFAEDYDFGGCFKSDAHYQYWKVIVLARALYFANRSLSKYRASTEIISCLNIPSFVLFELVQIAQLDEFSNAEHIFDEIGKSNRRKIAKIAGNSNQNNEQARCDEELLLEWYEKNRWMYKSPKKAAEDACINGNAKLVAYQLDAIYRWISKYNQELFKRYYNETLSQFDNKSDIADFLGKKKLNISPKIIKKWIDKFYP